jgi:hypothetical protein
MVAAKLATLGEGRPAKTAQTWAVTQADAARKLKVSRGSVQLARKVVNRGVPDLVALVERDGIRISSASRIADLTADEQQELFARGIEAVLEKAKQLRPTKEREETTGRAGERVPVVETGPEAGTDSDSQNTACCEAGQDAIATVGKVNLVGPRYAIFATDRVGPQLLASTVPTGTGLVQPVGESSSPDVVDQLEIGTTETVALTCVGRAVEPDTSIVPGQPVQQSLRDRILAILRDFLGDGRERRVAQANVAGTTVEEVVADEIVALCVAA